MAATTRERKRSGSSRRDADGEAPQTPFQLGRNSWLGVLRRTVQEFKQDNLTDWAAALTYYGILSTGLFRR